MNELEQVGLLAGDLEMAIVGAVWIMDIGKKRLVRVGGEQIQLSACWMDGCPIDADGSPPPAGRAECWKRAEPRNHISTSRHR